MSHTEATLAVSPETYKEIYDALNQAGYGQTAIVGWISMTGIRLVQAEPKQPKTVLFVRDGNVEFNDLVTIRGMQAAIKEHEHQFHAADAEQIVKRLLAEILPDVLMETLVKLGVIVVRDRMD